MNVLVNSLNNKQQEAVSIPYGNILILAGAGSGKTRVLVHRIAWLLLEKKCSPYSIMGVTFTNKAAKEMKHRLNKLFCLTKQDMWVGTFHSLAYRILRDNYSYANLPNNFHILDHDDQFRLIKKLIRFLNFHYLKISATQAMWYINTKKDEGLRYHNIKPEHYSNQMESSLLRIYKIYQDTCDRYGLVDFAELILRTNDILVNIPEILYHYRNRFTNILVDEFQDTNKMQYSLIRMLAGKQNNVMIVGDDDQSIYSWRGAKIENMHNFLKDFQSVKIIRLEQNYRSTNNILKAANALIANNKDRFGKHLWTKDDEGEPISIYRAIDEIDEALFVVKSIKKNNSQGIAFKDCAILYRNNTQSRVIEEALLHMNMPYRIYGGMRFFERQEVKDALAYLRLIINRNDDTAYERIINTPNRGIGCRSIDIIRNIARTNQVSLWQASYLVLQEHKLIKRAATSLQKFIDLVNSIDQKIKKLPISIKTDIVIKDSGLWQMYESEDNTIYNGKTRLANLAELVNATKQYNLYKNNIDNINNNTLQEFLSHIVLNTGVEEEILLDNHQDAVQMMTLHAAKGLEFHQVFIVGMEEGMFPSQVSIEEGKLEEERRLAYVGITRAMKKLTLSYSIMRRLYGKEVSQTPSRFIKELPIEFTKKIDVYTSITTNKIHNSFNNLSLIHDMNHFNVGEHVIHQKFGNGKILSFDNSGKNIRMQIIFQGKVIKWLVLDYARLEKITS